MHDGIYTTEFWGKTILQIVSVVIGLLVMTEVLDAGDGDTIVSSLALAVPAVLEAAYAISRGIAKAGQARSGEVILGEVLEVESEP